MILKIIGGTFELEFSGTLELEKKYFSLRTITHRNDHIKHQPT